MRRRADAFPWRLLALPLAFGAAVLGAHLLLLRAPLSIATDLAQPLPVATAWHDFGQTLWILVFGCIAAAAIPYCFTLLGLLRGSFAIGMRSVVLLSGLCLAACLCMPVVFSSDVYAYAAYGWMNAHGISPYAHLPLATHDALMASAIWQWSNPLPVCVYGPLFVWIAKECTIAGAPLGAAGQLLLLRLVSSSALVLCAPLMYLAMHDYGREQRMLAAVGIALNPVAIWVAAEGHNDTIVLAIVLLGFIAIRKFGYFAGAFIIAAAALIKATSVAAALVLALYVWRDSKNLMRVLAGIACGVLLTAIVARPFEEGVRGVLVPHGHYAPQFSPQFELAQILQSLFGPGIHSLQIGIAIVLVAAAALALHGITRIFRGEREGAAWLALAMWLAIPNPYPWYALWILPAAFLCVRMPVAWAIVAASLSIFLRYLPDVSRSTNADLNVALTVCIFALPVMFVLLQNRIFVAAPSLDVDSP